MSSVALAESNVSGQLPHLCHWKLPGCVYLYVSWLGSYVISPHHTLKFDLHAPAAMSHYISVATLLVMT